MVAKMLGEHHKFLAKMVLKMLKPLNENLCGYNFSRTQWFTRRTRTSRTPG